MAEEHLQSLTTRCHGELGRVFLRDAIQAFQAENYRSTVIMTWIAVTFDIFDKIAVQADEGQPAAVQFLERIESVRQSHDPQKALELEREILTTARRDFHLLEPIEADQLGELQTERHRCAHPSLMAPLTPYQPSKYRALHFLDHAVEYVLSRPPLHSRAAVDVLMQIIRADDFFTTQHNAKTRLSEGPINNPNGPLLKDVVSLTIKDCFLSTLTPLQRKQRVAALKALASMHTEEVTKISAVEVPRLFNRASEEGHMNGALLHPLPISRP